MPDPVIQQLRPARCLRAAARRALAAFETELRGQSGFVVEQEEMIEQPSLRPTACDAVRLAGPPSFAVIAEGSVSFADSLADPDPSGSFDEVQALLGVARHSVEQCAQPPR